jgi:hypothetical protein
VTMQPFAQTAVHRSSLLKWDERCEVPTN